MKLRIANGRVIDPASKLDGQHDILIIEDKIVAIIEQHDGFAADYTIDASGLIVCPGLIDLYAHLREPGHGYNATIESETLAAVSGGITTVVVPPNTDPVIDTPAVIKLIEDKARKVDRATVLTIGALTQDLKGELLSEMSALKMAGSVGISNSMSPIKNSMILCHAMEYAATLNLTVFINAFDPWLQNKGCVHEGTVSTRLGLPGIPEIAETIAIARYLLLIEQTGVRAHFHNISAGKTVKMIQDAQIKGLSVSADVSAHHLHLCELDLENYNSQIHVMPPLRSIKDRKQLRKGLYDGIIAAISSNHQPLNNDDKLGPFAETIPGISGLETLLPLTMKLVDDDEISLTQAIACLTNQPANILSIEAGHLKVGGRADICIINPNSQYACQPNNFISAGKNSPFVGWIFNNDVKQTLYKGNTVFKK